MARIVRKQFRQEDDKDMALELMSLDLKVDHEIIAMLRSEKALTGMTLKDTAVKVLREWAKEKVHESNVRINEMRRMGFIGVSQGFEEDQE